MRGDPARPRGTRGHACLRRAALKVGPQEKRPAGEAGRF